MTSDPRGAGSAGVRLALTPDRAWRTDPVALLEAAALSGFQAVGVAAGQADAALAAAYRRYGLDCSEVLALLVTEDGPATVTAAEGLAEAASRVGAPWVLTVFRAPLTTTTAATLARCAALFSDAGAGMAVEPSPLGPVSDLALGLEVVAAAERDGGRAGLLIDSWHFCASTSTWQDLARVPVERIAYVQFADALRPESADAMRETLHRRALPGDGVLDLRRFADTLQESGFCGTVSAEVLSADLRALPLQELTDRVHASLRRYWS